MHVGSAGAWFRGIQRGGNSSCGEACGQRVFGGLRQGVNSTQGTSGCGEGGQSLLSVTWGWVFVRGSRWRCNGRRLQRGVEGCSSSVVGGCGKRLNNWCKPCRGNAQFTHMLPGDHSIPSSSALALPNPKP